MRQRNRYDTGTADMEDVEDVKLARNTTRNVSERLLKFPAQRATRATVAREIATAYEALDSAMAIASSAYGVNVIWDEGDAGDSSDSSAPLPPGATALPGTLLVAGDVRRRRLVLSQAGLGALASASALRHAPLAVAMSVARMLRMQAGAILAVAAHVASPPSVLRGPSSTVEWVVAVLATQGLFMLKRIK